MSTRGVIAVVGATGHQGSAASRHLIAEGWKVRVLTRAPHGGAAARLHEAGAEIVEGDLDDARTLDVLAGSHGLFVVLTPFSRGNDAEVRWGRQLVAAAQRHRVDHLVYSSVANVEQMSSIPFLRTKLDVERAIHESGVPFTVLRPVSFMDAFRDLPPVRWGIDRGTLALPLRADHPFQFVAAEDVGFIAARVFDDPGRLGGHTIDVVGDELTMPGVAAALGRALGHPVRYRRLPRALLRPIAGSAMTLFDWLNAGGFAADPRTARSIHPGLLTLEAWAARFWRGRSDAWSSIRASRPG